MLTAVCRMKIEFEEKERNLKKALGMINKASERGAKLCLFPEMSFTGFSMNIELTGETDGYTLDVISHAAAENNIAVGFGYVRLNNGRGENHYVIVDKTGGVASDYIKIHSFAIGGESDNFISGSAIPAPANISGHSISTFICYDLRFPEIFRAAADGSTIMTVAANWPWTRDGQWKALLKARAIENQVYVIGINCIGEQDGIEYGGGCMVINPSGEVLAEDGNGTDDIIFADIINDVAERRAAFPALASRRNALYKTLY